MSISVKKRDEINKICEELNKFTDIDGTEVGELCRCLMNAISYPDYMTRECFNAIHKEIVDQLAYFHENFDIISREKTHTYIENELINKE